MLQDRLDGRVRDEDCAGPMMDLAIRDRDLRASGLRAIETMHGDRALDRGFFPPADSVCVECEERRSCCRRALMPRIDLTLVRGPRLKRGWPELHDERPTLCSSARCEHQQHRKRRGNA